MALLVIVDRDGKEHLIHSSQIGPPAPRPPEALGEWSDVWSRVASCPKPSDIGRVLGEPGQTFMGMVGKPPAV